MYIYVYTYTWVVYMYIKRQKDKDSQKDRKQQAQHHQKNLTSAVSFSWEKGQSQFSLPYIPDNIQAPLETAP